MGQTLEPPTILCERVKQVRNAHELSQADFAKRLGINRAHISRIESGKSVPSEQLLRLIAHEYDISWKWLTRGEGHMPQKFAILKAHQDELDLRAFDTLLTIFYQVNVWLMMRLFSELDKYSREVPEPLPPAVVKSLKTIKQYLPLDKIHPLIDKILADSTEQE